MADGPPTFEQREQFLELVAEGMRRDEAAEKVGSTGTRFRRLINEDGESYDREFALSYAEALKQGAASFEETIRQEIHQRALDRQDPQSARLLSKLADATLPEFVKLRERTTRHEGKVVHAHVDLTKLSDEKLEQLYEILEDASSDEASVIELPRAV